MRAQLVDAQQIQATKGAFAAILADGSVVTWGNPVTGGTCIHVQSQLRRVSQIQATDRAFAAITEGGSIVAWGDVRYGGDRAFGATTPVEPLQGVQAIQANYVAFAALLDMAGC